MKGFIVFLLTVLQVYTPVYGQQRILNANIVEGVMHEKDYMGDKGHFEKNANAVSSYADAAGTSPVDGTGGSPTLTCTRTTSSPLAGSGSLLITKDGSNRQGEGCAVAFSVDTKHKGQVLRISADYAVASGTYVDDDVRFFIYDVTNSRLIEPSANKIKNSTITSGNSVQAMEFQTSIDSTSYRLIMHVAGTNAAAFTLKLDDIKIGKLNAPRGPSITDPVAYTPTVGNFSPTVTLSNWYRNGDRMVINGYLTATGAASGTITVSIPSGYSIDTAKISPNLTTLGTAYAADATGNVYTGSVVYNATTSISFSGPNTASRWNATVPFTWASSDTISYIAEFPIVGWGSSQVLSSETDTRVVAARYTGTSSTTPTSLTPAVVKMATKVFDTHSAYDTSTGLYTCPVAGKYSVNVQYHVSSSASAASNAFDAAIYKNGSSVASRYVTAYITGAAEHSPGVSALVDCLAGDTIGAYLGQNLSGSNLTISNNTRTYIDIERVSGPSQIAANETVAVRYTGDGSGTLDIKTAGTKLLYATKVIDTHNAFVSSIFTAPVSGTYAVSGYQYIGAGASSDLSNGTIGIVCSDSSKSQTVANSIHSVANATTGGAVAYSTLIYLKAGETIQLQNTFTASGTLGQDRTAVRSWINIWKIGN